MRKGSDRTHLGRSRTGHLEGTGQGIWEELNRELGRNRIGHLRGAGGNLEGTGRGFRGNRKGNLGGTGQGTWEGQIWIGI